MFTKNIKDTFTKGLLDAVSGVLGEAKKKCSEGCECEACENERNEMEEAKEGYIPTQRNLTARDNETIGKLAALMKKEREAKEKKEPNGVKTEEVEELDEKRGLWDNIHAKRERIKRGSGERMRKPGSEGAPTAADFKASQKEEVQIDELSDATLKSYSRKALDQSKTLTGDQKVKRQVGARNAIDRLGNNTLAKEEAEQVAEVAPPGAKYERMVKHIKKAYAKDGKLTDKEKGIAYATAWKAKNEAIDPGLEDELMSQRQGESGKKWRVDHNGKTISTHNSKDAADVKAMKHPSYKVKANEEVELEEGIQSMSDARLKYHATRDFPHGSYTSKEIKDEHNRRKKTVANYHTVKASLGEETVDEAFEQLDELSTKKLGQYISATAAKGKEERKKRAAGLTMAVDKMSYPKGSPLAKKVPATNEEVEQVDEEIHYTVHKAPAGWHVNQHGVNGVWHHSVQTGYHDTKEKAVAWAKKHAGSRPHKIEIKEEQINELSKKTLGSYVKKAAGHVGAEALTAGLKIKDGENPMKNLNKSLKRQKGIETATDKLTKEEQDFIDALNDADIEQIDELSVNTLDNYRTKARKDLIDAGANDDNRLYNKRAKGYRAASKSVNKKLAKEEVELDEARGRPKKAGAKDFTIHPKTKEKLMHNNPEHMAKIEKLQKHGVLQKPKTEANQHIIQQLQRAKTSMRGGETVHFTHGDSTHVAGHHAAKLLDKYAGMKPHEKEAFQKKIGHSHANLKSEL